jgi:hypothetical protein
MATTTAVPVDQRRKHKERGHYNRSFHGSATQTKKSPKIFVDPHISDMNFPRGSREDIVESNQLGV